MAQALLAAGIAGLIALHFPLAASAQDASDEEQADFVADEEGDGADADSSADAADDAATDDAASDDDTTSDVATDDAASSDEATDDAADSQTDAESGQDAESDASADETADVEDYTDAYESAEFEYAGDDPDDPLFADDEFNDGEFDPVEDAIADDAVGIETGRDQIPDVYELYDEDGDSSFDEDFDVDDDEYDISGLFHDELPIIRQPSARSAGPEALLLPAVPAGQAAAWPNPREALATPGQLLRQQLAMPYAYGSKSAWLPGRQRFAGGGGAALAKPSVLSIFTGVFIPLQLGHRASAVYMVGNNGAPFQAAIRRATNPRTWTPAAKYRVLANKQDWEARHVCGGTLITEQWVLTAAHCLWSFSDGVESRAEASMAKGLSVLLGAEDISKPQSGTNYVVDRVIIHGRFNPRNIYRHDIALLHIVQRGAASRLNVISSIRRHSGAEPADRTKVSVMGWGKSRDENGQLAQTALWRADVNLIAAARCRTMPRFGNVNANGEVIPKIGEASLCAGESVGKACSGDSGGPLVFTNNGPALVGIVSWTVEDSCGRPAIPNVYTRVASYNGWIDAAMNAPAAPTVKVVYFPK